MDTENATTGRISPGAYEALREAMSLVFWNKAPFESYLRTALRDHPELLAGIDFQDAKRAVAAQLVIRLARGEHRYRDATLDLMTALADMRSFPNLRRQDDAERLTGEAEAAVAELRRWVASHAEQVASRERRAAELAGARATAGRDRAWARDLDDLEARFLGLHGAADPWQRGRDFETFLNRLFGLFGLEPREPFTIEGEQIDGSFSFDTDDYILEARWRKQRASREHLDVFDAKVRRKGKNALGLYISIEGFSADALRTYSTGTSFITMDGHDLIAILGRHIRLDDLLRRKKRHANDTGSCYFPVARML